ncbi:MAG: endolytic transglycosylase MltG [Candidatus Levybacteria bacterium]|nr:endolytic transglycosylase MltG [Candidatus Levybacteria bacterium]MBP9814837.1 endolytic transglycosylase MltG [Candidatus Levybacteria bacterium]
MRKLIVLATLFAIFIIGFFIWWKNGTSAVNIRDKSEKVFVVQRGAGIRAIGNNLKKEGLIRDPIVFFLFLKKNDKDTTIQAGDYKLSPSMNLDQLINAMSHGTLDIWVTVPEGMRADEIADILQNDIPSYSSSWREELNKNEGYLFPDTYLFPRDSDIATIISIFRNNFDKKISDAGLSNRKDLSDIIIIASLVEREALKDDEKPYIASVISNRLRDGMALDIDATLQYAKGKVGDKWWTVPVGEDRKINSPYNTYQNPGLPPFPIANPGIEAIRAAANPAQSTYYYYIHDQNGNVHFSKSLEEHQRNIDKYL